MQGVEQRTEDLPLGDLLLHGSLDEAAVLRATEDTPDYPILPWVNVVKIGGQSILDGTGCGRLPGNASLQALGAEPGRRPDPPATDRHRILARRRSIRRQAHDLRQGRRRSLRRRSGNSL